MGDDPPESANGEFTNYFVAGFIGLADGKGPTDFLAAFETLARHFGHQATTTWIPMVPPEPGMPQLVFLASFKDKESFESFASSNTATDMLVSHTTGYALVGGYDSKRPL